MAKRHYVGKDNADRIIKYLKRFGPLTTMQLKRAFPCAHGSSLIHLLRSVPQAKPVREDYEGITWVYDDRGLGKKVV